MRDIKFGAIYKPTGEHFNPISINFNDNSLVGDFDGQKGDWCYFSLDGKRGDAILRQYTGRKDENNNEIFEGDIVNLTYMVYAGHGTVDEVTEMVAVEDITKLPFGPSTIGCEIIGNIYENPKLLEVTE